MDTVGMFLFSDALVLLVIFTLIPFGQRTDSIDLFNFFEIYLGLYL
jgi:hypothetical protein